MKLSTAAQGAYHSIDDTGVAKRFQEAEEFERKRDWQREAVISAEEKEERNEQYDVDLANILRRQETEMKTLYMAKSRTARYGPIIGNQSQII